MCVWEKVLRYVDRLWIYRHAYCVQTVAWKSAITKHFDGLKFGDYVRLINST